MRHQPCCTHRRSLTWYSSCEMSAVGISSFSCSTRCATWTAARRGATGRLILSCVPRSMTCNADARQPEEPLRASCSCQPLCSTCRVAHPRRLLSQLPDCTRPTYQPHAYLTRLQLQQTGVTFQHLQRPIGGASGHQVRQHQRKASKLCCVLHPGGQRALLLLWGRQIRECKMRFLGNQVWIRV
jgi:hypothetical protein